jgi:formate dehydrogenase iron-sulfur subunit
MSIGVLVDMTRCIGCRSCQVACKSWNDNPGERTQFLGSYDNPPGLTPYTWSMVRFSEVETGSTVRLVMSKIQCMHCQYPACVAVCSQQVFQKQENGSVTLEGGKCNGCQECVKKCPFNVPRIEWIVSPELEFVYAKPVMTKCILCSDRVEEGMEPACVKACPTDALTFGDRDELLANARQRMIKFPGRYVDHIYGENEVGGTTWMYLSPVEFKLMGFPVY